MNSKKLFRKSYPLILLLILYSLLSCSPKEKSKDAKNKPENETLEMVFEVDSSKLGKLVVDAVNNIKFSPPLNWEPVPPELMETIMVQLSQLLSQETVHLNPQHIFLNMANGAMLSVSSLEGFSGDFPQQMKGFSKLLGDKFSGAEITASDFVKDGILFKQFLLRHSNMVNFKLVSPSFGNDLIQIDYVVQLNYYAQEVKSIESSMGSIYKIE